MATTVSTTAYAPGILQAAWSGLANGQSGDKADTVRWADRTVQVTGTFGASGAVVIEGSNDGVTWGSVTDHSNTVISLTDSRCKFIAENPKYLRPRVSAGDGTTSLSVVIIGRQG